jgi:succinyl-diaminopimelate desuccinylase
VATAAPTTVRDDLVARLLEHCSHLCTTGDEGPIADAVVARYEQLGEEVVRVGHSVVVGSWSGDRPLVLLVGHLDVVPPTDDDRDPRVETRDGRSWWSRAAPRT